MKSKSSIAICLSLTFLISCQSTVAEPTATPTRTPTHTQAPTFTPTLTPTITPTPTPIGGTEPKVAFVGKDSQGALGVYIDGFSIGKPEKISPVFISEDLAGWMEMRWSPDGQRLIYWDENEYGARRIFVYDTITTIITDAARVPGGKDIFDFAWSSDGNVVYFGAASRSNPRAVYYELDLSNGQVSETKKNFRTSHNSHVNSGRINCYDQASYPKPIYDLSIQHGGYGPNGLVYDGLCFYPELNAYGGLEYNEQTTDFVLLSPEGRVDKTVAIFPAGFSVSMDLSLSPNKSQILIIGEDPTDPEPNHFVYAAQLTNLPVDEGFAKLSGWRHVYGWSPDSLNYLIAEPFWNAAVGRMEARFKIIRADSGEVLYEYRIQNHVLPVLVIGQVAAGYDMVWPVLP